MTVSKQDTDFERSIDGPSLTIMGTAWHTTHAIIPGEVCRASAPPPQTLGSWGRGKSHQQPTC